MGASSEPGAVHFGDRFVPESELIRFPDLVQLLVSRYGLRSAEDVSSLEDYTRVSKAIEAELRQLGILGKKPLQAATGQEIDAMTKTSLLVDGNIPARTDCPFRSRCEVSEAGQCKHSGPFHRVAFSCAVARGFDLVATPEELARKPLTFELSGDDTHGWTFWFSAEIDEGNFIEACEIAIAAAKRACVAEETCAINFEALGVNVQVVETSDAHVQFELWKRSVAAKREAASKA